MSTDNESSFQNSNIQVALKKEPGCKIFLDVTVSPEATRAAYQKAVTEVKKEITLPGFRKGKAPDSMIHEKYAKYIEQEWKDILLRTTFDEAFQLVKLSPFNRDSVKVASLKSHSKEEGSKIHYEYESAPQLPKISPEALAIPTIEVKPVTEKQIDQTIESLALQSAEWTDIEDRPTQEGDYVMIDIDALGDSPRNICSNQTVCLKPGTVSDWIRNLLIGKKPGDSAEAMSEKDTHDADCQSCDDPSHNHDFTPTLCRIILHKIREAKLHPLDDALAKKFGASSFSDLKEKVKASLEKQAEEAKKDEDRRSIELELLKNYPFDMPASLVQGEIKAIAPAIMNNLRDQGLEKSQEASEFIKIKDELTQKYERDFRLYFLTQSYAKEHQLNVSQDEVMMEMMRQMWMEQSGQRQAADPALDQKERMTQLHLQLLAVKAIDDLIEKAKKLPKKA